MEIRKRKIFIREFKTELTEDGAFEDIEQVLSEIVSNINVIAILSDKLQILFALSTIESNRKTKIIN